MTRKQRILRSLYKSFLNTIAAEHGIIAANRIPYDDLVAILSRMRSVKVEKILRGMSLQDLKIICRNTCADEKGNKKAILIDRLLNRDKNIVPDKTKQIKKLKPKTVTNKKSIRSKHKDAASKATVGRENIQTLTKKREVGMVGQNFAPGARIVVRDAEWLVRKVCRTSTGGQALTVTGISELVKDKEAIFLDEIDKNIEVLDPVDTKLVVDTSSSYQKSLLYMESLLRQKALTDENLYIGHKAAMDRVPYQLDPAIQALKQPRQRILIADAVGLGKTLACGILVSELIRRGRGKRILVLAVKSMLTQFQKEMWSRFTIPLVRLDSIGIQRVRSRIPTNHNPFYYYDKSIISIDTLKQDAEYRTYLENAYWDIIVIDEAHNVAQRGKGSSQRAKLAKLLSGRSDTLIMLSATPHDGRARSFASLMNMLDPTAIANPDDYGPDDIKGLFIRRFKKDIQNQVQKAFKKREISNAYCQASDAEEAAFNVFAGLKFEKLDQRRGAGQLFKTTLEKALFSSPAACLQTIKNRINRLKKDEDRAALKDIGQLEKLATTVKQITPDKFSKYQKLLSVIQDRQHGFRWTGKAHDERLVIFTERIETLRFLHQNLPNDLNLKDKQVEILHGSMPDVDQQRVVEDFGKEEVSSPASHRFRCGFRGNQPSLSEPSPDPF